MQSFSTSLPEAILLGLIQGLTEFLPISSSGHLVLAQAALRSPGLANNIALEIILHAGTLLAVIATYWRDLWRMLSDGLRFLRHPSDAQVRASTGVRELGLLCLATVPVVVAGLLLKDPIEAAFESPRFAALMLFVTGILLLATRFLQRPAHPLRMRIALPMGLMQVLSLLPGISRSGATICGGLFGGGRPGQVVRFSFLMSIPAILGAVIFQLPDLREALQAGVLVSYGVGFIVSFTSGMMAIQILLRVVVRGRFFLFGIYCILASLLAWILLSIA